MKENMPVARTPPMTPIEGANVQIDARFARAQSIVIMCENLQLHILPADKMWMTLQDVF